MLGTALVQAVKLDALLLASAEEPEAVAAHRAAQMSQDDTGGSLKSLKRADSVLPVGEGTTLRPTVPDLETSLEADACAHALATLLLLDRGSSLTTVTLNLPSLLAQLGIPDSLHPLSLESISRLPVVKGSSNLILIPSEQD